MNVKRYGKPEDLIEFADFPDEGSGVKVFSVGDLHTCTASGSSCSFGLTTYEHCGKYCGIYESAGGGTPINTVDICCRDHDICLDNNSAPWLSPCNCHEDLLYCYGRNTAPGDEIMSAGIWYQENVTDGCDIPYPI